MQNYIMNFPLEKYFTYNTEQKKEKEIVKEKIRKKM